MAIILLASASGAPGVSTSASGLALAWDRDVLLLEADPTGASAMLTGYMQQYAPQGIPSLMDLAVQFRQSNRLPDVLSAAVRVPETKIRLISGLRNHTHVSAVASIWPTLINELTKFDEAGIDVIVDMGRLGLVGSPDQLLNAADLILLTTRSTLGALVPANNWVKALEQRVGGQSGRLGLLVIGPGHPESATAIEKALKAPVVASLPLDPVTAEVFSNGAKKGRRFERSPLYRSLPPAVGAIRQQLERSQQQLHGERK